MISRTTIGRSFAGLVRYQFEGRKDAPQEKQAEILTAVGVRSDSAAHMIADFNRGRQLNPNLGLAVWHTSLSFNPDDAARLDSTDMRAIAESYVRKMGLDKTQYVIVRHHDQPDNQHLHILANRVSDDGKTIKDGQNFFHSKRALTALIQEYNLTPPQGLRPEKQHPERLRGADKTKYEIREALRTLLATATSGPHIKKQLLAQGIRTKFFQKDTGKSIGSSFEKGGHTFKGSDLGKAYSIASINKQLDQNRARQQAEQARQEQLRQQEAAQVATQQREQARQEAAQKEVAAQRQAVERLAREQAQREASLAHLSPLERKWYDAYQDEERRIEEKNQSIRKDNYPFLKLQELFRNVPTINGLERALEIAKKTYAYSLPIAVEKELNKLRSQQDSFTRFVAERERLEEQAKGLFGTGFGIGKQVHEAREKLAVLAQLTIPAYSVPTKYAAWAAPFQQALTPSPPTMPPLEYYLQKEELKPALKEFANEQEAIERAKREVIVTIHRPENVTAVQNLLWNNGTSRGMPLAAEHPLTKQPGTHLIFRYTLRSPDLKELSKALDQVQRQGVGIVREPDAERRERQAPGQRDLARQQGRQGPSPMQQSRDEIER